MQFVEVKKNESGQLNTEVVSLAVLELTYDIYDKINEVYEKFPENLHGEKVWDEKTAEILIKDAINASLKEHFKPDPNTPINLYKYNFNAYLENNLQQLSKRLDWASLSGIGQSGDGTNSDVLKAFFASEIPTLQPQIAILNDKNTRRFETIFARRAAGFGGGRKTKKHRKTKRHRKTNKRRKHRSNKSKRHKR